MNVSPFVWFKSANISTKPTSCSVTYILTLFASLINPCCTQYHCALQIKLFLLNNYHIWHLQMNQWFILWKHNHALSELPTQTPIWPKRTPALRTILYPIPPPRRQAHSGAEPRRNQPPVPNSHQPPTPTFHMNRPVVLQPANGYHTTTAKPQHNTNTHRTRYV